MIASDGVYEHVDDAFIAEAIRLGRTDLDAAARAVVQEAYHRGSPDNLTVQIVAIDDLPAQEALDAHLQLPMLPPPPLLEAGMALDGYRIVRELHGSSRSHVYLAVDVGTDGLVVIKTPSVDLQGDPAYLERFLMEEWVARRVSNTHVLKAATRTRKREHLYVATEFIDGQTLSQWMLDNPKPSLESVRAIVEQIVQGLQAFHRLEMLHQDLRPENIMIDKTGTVTIIDFGATCVAGITELATPLELGNILGTAQYTAPEYFLGEPGSARSDLFSLAVITYQMLCGRLPFGTAVSSARTRSAQRQLRYASVLSDEREIPLWIDEVLRKALHPDPLRRHDALSEYVHDLRHPGQAFLPKARPPLIERYPVHFWKVVSALLTLVVLALLMERFGAK